MMIKAFDGNKILKGSRNWCLVQERHLVPGSPLNDGALLFQVRVVNEALLFCLLYKENEIFIASLVHESGMTVLCCLDA